MGKNFEGGIHPSCNKITAKEKIKIKTDFSKVILPVSQHIGSLAEPIVKIGDEVKKGQLIAQTKDFVSSPVHSSIFGKVIDIAPYPHPLGKNILSIVIESDDEEDDEIWDEKILGHLNYNQLSPSELCNIIHNAGIVGLGGASFPTHVKLTPPKDKPIDTVILNGVECEPYLTADHRLMLEHPEEIIIGLKIILKILNVKTAYIGIEENKEDAIREMNKVIFKEKGIKVIPLKVKYPQGAEKQLIKAILNREVPSGGLPFDIGVVVQNVGTAFAIKEAVMEGKPLIERVITVTGKGIIKPQNLKVSIGALFKDVIEECGGYNGNLGKIIMGGPMMGIAQYTDEVPVIKGCSGILVFPQNEVKGKDEFSCISCGRCINACPMKLSPCFICDYIERENFESAEEYGILDCIECGCCSYICPSNRKIIHWVKYGKLELQQRKKK
ncbi:MAG: electron transport complex subunit RsxC [bacterium]